MSDSSWSHDREGLTNERNEVTLQRQEQVRRKILTTGEFWTASCARKFTINKNRGKKWKKKPSAICMIDLELITLIYKQLFKSNTKTADHSTGSYKESENIIHELKKLNSKYKQQ